MACVFFNSTEDKEIQKNLMLNISGFFLIAIKLFPHHAYHQICIDNIMLAWRKVI